MLELVKIEKRFIGTEEQDTVNGRDLWRFLLCKRQFGNWIKENLEIFSESEDYQVFNINVKNLKGPLILPRLT